MTVLQEPVQVPTPGRHGLGLAAALRPQGPARPGLAWPGGGSRTHRTARSPGKASPPPGLLSVAGGGGPAPLGPLPRCVCGAAGPGCPLRRWERARPAGQSGRSPPPSGLVSPWGFRASSLLRGSPLHPLRLWDELPSPFCPSRAPAQGAAGLPRRRCGSPAAPQLSRLPEKALSAPPVDPLGDLLIPLSSSRLPFCICCYFIFKHSRRARLCTCPANEGRSSFPRPPPTFRLMGDLGEKIM